MAENPLSREQGASLKDRLPVIPLGRYVALLAAVWTGVMVLSLAGNLYQERQATLEIARTAARSRISQMALYRHWNALHKGVYVEADEQTPANPYLSQVPERDLVTPSGRKLTLVNPAYMTRQIYELGLRQKELGGRIISLRPLRPENTPDVWESQALKKLEQGGSEYSSVDSLPDQDYLRLLRPLIAEKACLECHASQGYREGDIRGGISVMIPLPPLRIANQRHVTMIWLSHGFLWLLGLGGICLAATRLDKSLTRQQRTELDLLEANRTLEALIEASPLAIIALDTQGRVRLWNPAAVSIFGWQASQVMGKLLPFLTENLDSMFQEIYSRGLQGEPVRGVAMCQHRNGMTIEFSFSMSPLRGPQESLEGIMAILEDITERRRTEEELFKANEELKVWVYEFSRRNKDITLLNEMGDHLQACRSLEEAYAGVSRFASRMFPDLSGTLFMFNAQKHVLEAAAHWGEPRIGETIFPPDECWALRTGKEHLVQETDSDSQCGHLDGFSRGYMCVPMIAHGEILGLLSLLKNAQESSPDETLADSKRRLAITAAKQIALSMANLNLRNSLQEQAIRDPLTGLFNRRYMEETLQREIFRVRRKGAPLGIIMLDLDYFKHFNDTFGHEGGDVLLQALAGMVRRHIRREDIACRYGGEEFIIIMPEAPLQITAERAELLRQQVRDLQVTYQDRPLGAITMSLGVAAFPDHGADGEALIRAADGALYRAKEGGRNRVVVAG